MKSRKIFITIIAAAAVFVSGCSKFLDVHPKGEKINMFETAEEYEDALYGVYNELTGANLYGQYIYLLPEVLSQNFTTSDYKYSELAEGEMTTQGATATKRDIWKSAYTAVNHINNIVEHAEDDIDTYKHSGLYLGEALALRALVHFELLKLFGPPYWASDAEKKQVLPYVTKYSFDIKDFDSYDAVYESILSDLGRAEEYLAEDATLVPADRDKTANSFTDARIAHMNLYAVQSLIAKVYWSKDDLDNAEKYAEKVISSGKFSFRPASAFVQPDNGTLDLHETIFGLYVSDESTMMKKLALSETVGSSAMRLASDYSVLYEKNSGASTDYRLSAWFDPSIPACRKMVNNIFITGSNTYNGKSILGYDVIRLPELYYIVAEANITKDPAKAKEYFDKVLKSRGRETLEESGEQLTEDLLFEEREREFYGEGFTWFDMKKERKDIMTVSGKTLPGNVAATYTLTVPDEEWESRKNIEI